MARLRDVLATLQRPKEKFSLQHLVFLCDVLEKYSGQVSGKNQAVFIESLRQLAELIVWGDQNDPRFFDIFLEKSTLSHMLRGLGQRMSVPVQIQLVQTLSILMENLKSEMALFYILSNNHINELISYRLEFADEDLMANYISFLKTVSLKLNPQTLQFFFNERQNEFPLYMEAIKFYNHPESMIRVAVRTLTLNVYKVEDQAMRRFILDKSAAAYFSNLVCFISSQSEKLDRAMVDATHQRRGRLQDYTDELLDLFYYLHDVLALGIEQMNQVLTFHLLEYLFLPLFVASIVGEGGPPGQQLLSRRLALFLVAQALHTFTHAPLVNACAAALFARSPGRHATLHALPPHLASHKVEPAHLRPPSPVRQSPKRSAGAALDAIYSSRVRPLDAAVPAAPPGACRATLLQLLHGDCDEEILGALCLLYALLRNVGAERSLLEEAGLCPYRLSKSRRLLDSLTGPEAAAAPQELFHTPAAQATPGEAADADGTAGAPAEQQQPAQEEQEEQPRQEEQQEEPQEQQEEKQQELGESTQELEEDGEEKGQDRDLMDQEEQEQKKQQQQPPGGEEEHEEEEREEQQLEEKEERGPQEHEEHEEQETGQEEEEPGLEVQAGEANGDGGAGEGQEEAAGGAHGGEEPHASQQAPAGSSPPPQATQAGLPKPQALEEAGLPKPQALEEESGGAAGEEAEEVVDALLGILLKAQRFRIVTLQLAILLFKELVSAEGQEPRLGARHRARLEVAHDMAAAQLRERFVNGELGEVFLELFEDEIRAFKQLSFERLVADEALLLPLARGPTPGVRFALRLPAGDVEETRRAIQHFLLLRELKFSVLRQRDELLPLRETRPQAALILSEGARVELEHRAWVECEVVSRKGVGRRCLVVEGSFLLVVEPLRDGGAVLQDLLELQNMEAAVSKGDQCTLLTKTGSMTFETEEKCAETKVWIEYAKKKVRQEKLLQLYHLLGVDPMEAAGMRRPRPRVSTQEAKPSPKRPGRADDPLAQAPL